MRNMKYLKSLSFFTFLIMGLILTSCGDDDDNGAGNVDCNSSIAVNNAIAQEVDNISTALNAWVADMSDANCDALKEAYQDYIDALQSLQDCANQAGVGAEFAQSLADAEANIANLAC